MYSIHPIDSTWLRLVAETSVERGTDQTIIKKEDDSFRDRTGHELADASAD